MTNRLTLTCLLLTTVWLAESSRLKILPAQPVQTKAVGDTVLLTCRPGDNEDKALFSDLKWIAPDGSVVTSDKNTNRRIKAENVPGNPPSLGLFIQELRENDAGVYTCTALYARNGNETNSVEIAPYIAIQWINTPTEQFPVIHTDFKIKCEVKSRPHATLQWLRDGDAIKSDDHHVIETDGLLIKNVTKSDEGIYRCRAIVQETGQLKDRDITVEVHIPPSIVRIPPKANAVEGQSASITCEAEGKPKPEYMWIKTGTQQDLGTVNRFSVDKVNGILTIEKVEERDQGAYTCVAKNAAGEVTSNTELNVIILPRIVEYKNISVKVGEDAELVCKVTGRPLPNQVTFRKLSLPNAFTHGIQPNEERITVEQTREDGMMVARLMVANLLRSDDGLYACIARNEGGEGIKNGHLTVEFPPSFLVTPQKDAWSWDNNPVNITCLAESIPNASLSWKFENREVNKFSNIKQIGNGPKSILQVTPVGENSYGIYLCTARNIHGEAEHKIHLKKARKPEHILQAKLDIITATTITFKFIGPHTNEGLPIKAYIVKYKGSQESWEEAKEKEWPVDSSYILENLEPQTKYNFKFAAMNDVGVGEFAAEEEYTMPKRSPPEEPRILTTGSPLNGVMMSPYPNTYEIQWNVPADNGEPIDLYELKYCEAKNESGGWKEIKGKCEVLPLENSVLTTYKLESLNPDTYYKIELRARNQIGFSSPNQIYVKTARDPTRPNTVRDGNQDNGSSKTTAGTFFHILLSILISYIYSSYNYQH